MLPREGKRNEFQRPAMHLVRKAVLLMRKENVEGLTLQCRDRSRPAEGALGMFCNNNNQSDEDMNLIAQNGLELSGDKGDR
jgi:hypothetical protein